jgi:hypothetical protein
MGLMDMLGKAGDVAAVFGDVGEEGIKKAITEYKKAISVLETFGITVGSFTIGMGILPEIHTSLVGSIANIHEDAVQAMIDAHKGEDLLVALLKALLWARWGWEHLELKVTDLTLHVTLGLPPKITTEVH